MKKISFYPLDLRDKNSYIYRMYQAIKLSVGKEVVIENLNIKKWKFFINSDIFWLNWYENLNNRNLYTIIYSISRKLVELLFMKIFGGRIIVVVHNKQPHEIAFYGLTIWFMRYLLKRSDIIIVLCDEGKEVVQTLLGKTVSNKIVKISHPSYKCAPKQFPISRPDKFVVLFLGLIRPYKNIELLIKLALKYSNFYFIISGKAFDSSYGSRLKEMVNNAPNIFLEYKHNTDEELNKLMEEASVMVLPYHKASSLNSGMAMYAFSKGLNVVMPEIGTIKDLKNRDMVFAYSYTTEEEHFIALENALLNAYNLFINDYNDFVNRCIKIREEVLYTCSLESIANQIQKANIL